MNAKIDTAEWVRRAQQDVELQNRALQEPPMWEGASFHAQQSAEKLMKAYLIHNGWHLKRTHDLTDLLADCVDYDSSLSALTADCTLLTPFAMAGRYAGHRILNRSEYEAAIAAAERIRAEILKRLPSSHA
jgi:HEPN domain-containing protein